MLRRRTELARRPGDELWWPKVLKVLKMLNFWNDGRGTIFTGGSGRRGAVSKAPQGHPAAIWFATNQRNAPTRRGTADAGMGGHRPGTRIRVPD